MIRQEGGLSNTHPAARLTACATLGVLFAAGLGGCATPGLTTDATQTPRLSQSATFDAALADLEGKYDARIGVFALDTATGATVEFRADDRFAFASAYKALAAAAVLQQNTIDELEAVVAYDAAEVVDYSPVTEHAAGQGMTLRELAVAAVQYSDNTAGNLLLDELGGASGFQAILRGLGDDVTVVARRETDLNEYSPGDERDTSTPRAFATDLERYVSGSALDDTKREILGGWLAGNTTGDTLIRAGVPDGWLVGDKSGAASYGTRNDLGVVWRAEGTAPIVLAIFSDRGEPGADYDDALIAEAAKIVFDGIQR